ncbi:MAG TPA: ABC transporter permease [Spirochaetia bacterium]|nr:ABC transporter permease [Spirochaetia bacterium]
MVKEREQAGTQSMRQGFALRGIVRAQEFGVFLILAAMVLFLSLFTNTFLTSTNIFNILRAFSWVAISSFGECMVIITGGIDLSVGSVMGLSGLIAAMLLRASVNAPLAVAGGLAGGIVIGLLNGLMVTKARLPPFIATLGMLLMARGLCYGVTGGWPVQDLPQGFRNLGQYDIPFLGAGIPLPLVFVVGFGVVMAMFLKRTVWGYRIYAVGGNEVASGLSGISTDRVKLMVYILCAFLTAVGGILMTARLGVAAPTAASGYELDVIAAAVVGGTSLAGGEGTILGALIGAAIMQVLRTGLVLTGVSAYWLQAVQGLVIVVAIMLDQLRKRQR